MSHDNNITLDFSEDSVWQGWLETTKIVIRCRSLGHDPGVSAWWLEGLLMETSKYSQHLSQVNSGSQGPLFCQRRSELCECPAGNLGFLLLTQLGSGQGLGILVKNNSLFMFHIVDWFQMIFLVCIYIIYYICLHLYTFYLGILQFRTSNSEKLFWV